MVLLPFHPACTPPWYGVTSLSPCLYSPLVWCYFPFTLLVLPLGMVLLPFHTACTPPRYGLTYLLHCLCSLLVWSYLPFTLLVLPLGMVLLTFHIACTPPWYCLTYLHIVCTPPWYGLIYLSHYLYSPLVWSNLPFTSLVLPFVMVIRNPYILLFLHREVSELWYVTPMIQVSRNKWKPQLVEIPESKDGHQRKCIDLKRSKFASILKHTISVTSCIRR